MVCKLMIPQGVYHLCPPFPLHLHTIESSLFPENAEAVRKSYMTILPIIGGACAPNYVEKVVKVVYTPRNMLIQRWKTVCHFLPDFGVPAHPALESWHTLISGTVAARPAARAAATPWSHIKQITH